MRVIIAGSRNITEQAVVDAAIAASGFEITQVISGNARGVDQLGETWAIARRISLKLFPAEWDLYGRSAGFRRNAAMVKFAAETGGALVAVWDGKSPGTKSTIDLAHKAGLQVYIYTYFIL